VSDISIESAVVKLERTSIRAVCSSNPRSVKVALTAKVVSAKVSVVIDRLVLAASFEHLPSRRHLHQEPQADQGADTLRFAWKLGRMIGCTIRRQARILVQERRRLRGLARISSRIESRLGVDSAVPGNGAGQTVG